MQQYYIKYYKFNKPKKKIRSTRLNQIEYIKKYDFINLFF